MKAYKKTPINGVLIEIDIAPQPIRLPRGFLAGYYTALRHQSTVNNGRWCLNGKTLEEKLNDGF